MPPNLGGGLIPLMILDGSLLADAPRYVPTGRWDDWCEAGTRRGHYNRCRLQAGGMTGARTTTDVDYGPKYDLIVSGYIMLCH